MDDVIHSSLLQLFSQAPVLLVYVAGFVLAWAFRRRCPKPALLVLIATALLLVTAVVGIFAHQYLLLSGAEADPSGVGVSWMMRAATFTTSSFRAAGLGLLVVAVFLERGPPPLPRP